MKGWQTRIEYLVDVCRFCRWRQAHSCRHSCRGAMEEAARHYKQERGHVRMEKYEGGSEGHYGKTVMEALHEVLGIGMDEDKGAIRREHSLDEILDAVLAYEGIVGYSGKLVNVIEEIFGVNLLEVDV